MRRRAFLAGLGTLGMWGLARRAPGAVADASRVAGPPDVDRFTRVVTAVDADGHSVIESSGPPPNVTHPRHPQQVLTDLWSIDALPADYSAPGDRAAAGLQPQGNGVRIIRNKLPPDALMYTDDAGAPRVPRADEFLHRTRTIDFIQVIEGELWLVLENGEEAHLRAGDCVVQRGTVHAWRNRTSHPTIFLAVLVAADDATLPAKPRGPEALHGALPASRLL